MIEISVAVVFDDPDSCTNAGPCCFSCPHFDACDHHFEEDQA